jgi:putative ABC transport system permease protein
MLKNYIRIAWRNLRRNAFYSALNITCLSIGVACGLILFLFIQYHLAFNTYHRKAPQLYRVVTDLCLADGSVQYERGAPEALDIAIHKELPQVTGTAFLFQNYRDHVFTVAIPPQGDTPGKLFSEHGNIGFADKRLFNLFDYTWLAGNPATALEQPNTAVLTRSQAAKYFGGANPLGKTIRLDGQNLVTITGLLADYSVNTDIKADVYISWASMPAFYPDRYQDIENGWGWINDCNYLFVLLPEGLPVAQTNQAIARLTREHWGDMAKYFHFHLQPLKELHFDLKYGGAISKSLLMTLALIGLIILAIACVNFVNLATAQNTRRTKEISTRRILGSSPAGIFWQFMIETAVITLFAVGLALLWTALVLPVLNTWLDTRLALDLLHNGQLLGAIFSVIAFIILAAGAYPSLLLARSRPVDALKSRSGAVKKPWLRKGLLVFQNVVAQSLIICTLIIALQTYFLKTANLGFNKDAVLMVPVPKPEKKDLSYLRDQLLSHPDIKDVSFCFRPPSSETFKGGSIRFDHREWEPYTALAILGDTHYLHTFGLQLLAGRNLQESDTVREFLVSEAMIKKLGLKTPADVLGHQLVAGTLDDHPGTIVGVVADINLKSLHSTVEPLLITTHLPDYAYAGVKISGSDPAASIAEIKKTWESIYSGHIFEYRFLDEQIADFYKKEALLNRLIASFAALAILICCVGLLGLISLLTLQRTKEIGIRKVLGASVANIMALLSRDFAQLVVLALVLASAIAWMVMHNWLEGFAYRIAIPWWVFLVAGCCNLALALLTIGYHAVRAALANPATTLRSE